ncbi:MAG: DUF1611 domain-containing protein [Candidatus Eisenbacteria bacterium]
MFKPDRLAILAEGKLGLLTSKTAACVIRYRPEQVVCVIDSTRRGLTVGDVLGFGGAIPVVGSLEEAMTTAPDSLLMGIAPRGGALPPEWRRTVLSAIDHGLNVISGLHTLLGDDSEIVARAGLSGVEIWDIRRPVIPEDVAQGELRDKSGLVVLTVGSDCRSGKMTVAYELARALNAEGVDAEFVPTGQTGILLAGWGVAVDRLPGDFMSRVVEDLTVEALSRSAVAVVEGQGSLVHPAYSGVTLALMHGCYADAMILCHQPGKHEIEGYGISIPPLRELIAIYEQAYAPVFPSRVIAVALNTYELDEDAATAAVTAAEDETGLPAADVVRFGCGKILKATKEML